MKMRKLLASLAAAATMLSGLALGAGTAMADGSSASDSNGRGVITTDVFFQFKASDPDQWHNRTVKYYKLADYVDYTYSGPFGVQTATGADRAAIKAALQAAMPSDGSLKVPDDNKTDLMAWALQQGALDSEEKPWAGSTRKFAESLAKNTTVTSNLQTITWPNNSDGTSQEGNTNRWVKLPAGVYLFLDTATNGTNSNIGNGSTQDSDHIDDTTGGKVATQSAPIVLASGYVKDGELQSWNNHKDEAYNTVEFKNHVTPVVKTFDDADGTVSTGQDVNYTLTSELPAYTTGFTDYQFSLTDTPGVGQTVNLNYNFTVKVGGKEIRPKDDNNPNGYELKLIGLTAEEEQARKFDGDGTKQFAVDLSKYLQSLTYDAKADLKVAVTYNVTINKQSLTSATVPNSVEVNDNNAKAQDQTTLKLGQFSFVKKTADGISLAGAEFKIAAVKAADGDKAVAFTPTTDMATSASKPATAQGTPEGTVTFSGLADGVYEVTETKVPEGFLGHKDDGANATLGAKFQVTIKGGKAVYFHGTDIYGLSKDSGNADLTGGEITDYSVINVRNVTELPKTGAAGVALFGVLAVLLAGAGVTIFMKSRATKRALRS
ncbi:isopeptide-forming domain-containing fimbrial protein [Bifidobacterium sp. LC6]|uniref:Isopeptide-forming domain-containing fimbrial protein n=1 Tax=Bifidobacterium colobi TaxID=2809026 RepID=A0ABS5UT48_9BIFI|nr:isopeptide-forming domain-containing fimbrial protein [Bifidobacterium colobi]MBT1174216.1 isopeptide-forming domain-containing fimbrial protein [Bifidobacterium colobi]